MTANLFDALRAGKDLTKPALIKGWDSALSYGELFEASGRLANRLTGLGVKPGDRVAAQVGKSAEALILYLATLRAGAVYLPLNTDYTGSEIAYFLDDAQPSLFVGRPETAEEDVALAADAGATFATLGTSGDAGTLLEGLAAISSDFDDIVRKSDDLAAILYTSGTTGRSKGAMLSHGNLLSNAQALATSWRFSDEDELLHALPIYHTHGLFVATNVSLLSGATIRLLPKFDVDAIFRGLRTATVMMGVPTFYTRLLADRRLDRESTAGMRLFISGSAPLLAETHRTWEAKTGHRILERYGMTETNMNTSNPYDGDRRPGTVGPALPGVSIRVVDEQMRTPVQTGEIGMIEVRGPNVFQGYWRMPEKTAAELMEDGYFITGDLGRLDADGYLEIVGREKDLVITGGLNVYPKEVETEIDAIDGVEESAVIGLPHADFGEVVTAAIVRSVGSKIGSEEILSLISRRLARFKLPKTVYFVDSLPRNAMGKVQKNILRTELSSIVS